MYREPKGPREWLPGPKDWKTFEISSEGKVFLDGKSIGDMRRPEFRTNPEMNRLMDLWTELNEAYYRAEMKEGQTFPVRGFLHRGESGYAELEVKWSTPEIWPDVVKVVHELMDRGFRVSAQKPYIWVDVRSLKDYKKATAEVIALSEEHGILHTLPMYAAEMREIVEWAARSFFVVAWADRQEERGITYPGQELFDVAPETPKKARETAWELLKELELKNKTTMFEAYDQALQNAKLENTAKNREEFGYLLAMESMGHGLSLEDHFPDHGLEVPEMEFYL